MDRQTQAVAEELVRRGLVSHSLAEEVAKVAISASDAKYVPELVKLGTALVKNTEEWFTQMNAGRNPSNTAEFNAAYIALMIYLEKLPPELRK